MPGTRRRQGYRHLDAFQRGRIVGLCEAGWSTRRIAAHVHRDARTVGRCWHQWLQEGSYVRRSGSGAVRQTSPRLDRRIIRHARSSPETSAADIRRAVSSAMDVAITTRTVNRRLHEANLRSRLPLRRLPLTASHRSARLAWCRGHANWGHEWTTVVFSDESRFCLGADDRRIRVWRHPGERTDPGFVRDRHTARQPGIMVWGAIAYDSRSPLVRITGTLTAARYVSEVLQPILLPFLNGLQHPIFQQDNARVHTARVSRQCLQHVQTLPWPARSPDVSPIENLWDHIGRRLQANRPAHDLDDLWEQVNRAWCAIPQDDIRRLYDSLPRRIAACIAVRGGATTY